MIIIATQDKSTLTKFSLHIKFHKKISIVFLLESIVLRSYVRRLCEFMTFLAISKHCIKHRNFT